MRSGIRSKNHACPLFFDNIVIYISFMKVTIVEARELCEKILTKNGVSVLHAKIIIDDYIEGELLGKETHGLLKFIGDYSKIINTHHKQIIIEKNDLAYALVNGNKQVGQLVAKKARDMVIKKAKKTGIAMVALNNTTSFLRPGSQAEYISQHGLIGIVFESGGAPKVPPFGGIDPVIGTNPIGYAIPTNKNPIVADLAISGRAWGLEHTAKVLPKNLFIDKNGYFTQEPKKAHAVVPFGGYKGFALGFLFEILTGSLVGAGLGEQKKKYDSINIISGIKAKRPYRGALFIAIDPSKFVNFKKFKSENSKFIDRVKQSRRRNRFKKIIITGEKSYSKKIKNLQRGWFDVSQETWKKVLKLKKINNI